MSRRCVIHWACGRNPTRAELRAIGRAWRAGFIRCGDSVAPARRRFNPSDAEGAFTEFHWGRSPRRIRRTNLPDLSELFELGKLRAVEYSTTKGRTRATWVHPFRKPYPSLTATPDGQLGPILGGRAVVTRRGIEG